MLPVKVEITWIADNEGIEYPCEKELYLDRETNSLFDVYFCYPYVQNLDSEFARFLTRVVQENSLPEDLRQEGQAVCTAGKRLAAFIRELSEEQIDLELVEQITEVFGLANFEFNVIENLEITNPIVVRYVLMQTLNTQSYQEFVARTNSQRSTILLEKQQKIS